MILATGDVGSATVNSWRSGTALPPMVASNSRAYTALIGVLRCGSYCSGDSSRVMGSDRLPNARSLTAARPENSPIGPRIVMLSAQQLAEVSASPIARACKKCCSTSGISRTSSPFRAVQQAPAVLISAPILLRMQPRSSPQPPTHTVSVLSYFVSFHVCVRRASFNRTDGMACSNDGMTLDAQSFETIGSAFVSF